jgi:hypothetical protein
VSLHCTHTVCSYINININIKLKAKAKFSLSTPRRHAGRAEV